MRTLLVKNAKVISNDAILANHAVLSRNDVIETVMPDSDVNGLNADEIINAGGMYIAPGYIDLHIHGTRQYLVEEGREHLEELCKLLHQNCVTGYLPTVCPKTS
ncbi:MAG: hypothetical protein Q7J78_07900 [Clostridiales bacterium]|nr:hypothetical protein [Clostridiales bacterium]